MSEILRDLVEEALGRPQRLPLADRLIAGLVAETREALLEVAAALDSNRARSREEIAAALERVAEREVRARLSRDA